jgi:hypothetical protein
MIYKSERHSSGNIQKKNQNSSHDNLVTLLRSSSDADLITPIKMMINMKSFSLTLYFFKMVLNKCYVSLDVYVSQLSGVKKRWSVM